MSSETAVTRIQAYVDAHPTGVEDDSAIIDLWRDGAGNLARLTLGDVRALLKIVADMCEDHDTCHVCGTVLCETCGIGDIAECLGERIFAVLHCEECQGGCGECQREYAAERRAEQLWGAR